MRTTSSRSSGIAVAVLAVELDGPVDRRLAREAAAADRDPLVHERRERDAPAVADVAEPVARRECARR